MIYIEGLDEEKVRQLAAARIPSAVTADSGLRVWQKRMRDEVIEEYRAAGRLDELMLGNVNESVSDVKTDDAEESVEFDKNTKRAASLRTTTKKSKRRSKSTNESVQLDTVTVHSLPKEVMDIIKQSFPGDGNKADYVSAMAYVFSSGACKISEKAMALVKANPYGAIIDNSAMQYADVIKMLQQQNEILRRQNKMLTSIELCAVYDAFHRIYGSKERRAEPRNMEFREKGCLEMLARLREEALDQYDDDQEARGRAIYEAIKGKNDK